MKFSIELTWSKVMALLVLGYALSLDLIQGTNINLQYSLPFVVFLITGKQYLDERKKKVEN